MKLYHKEWNWGIDFQENKGVIFVVENRKLFSQLLFEIKYQTKGEEGPLVLSEGKTEYKLSKEAECIIDPFELDFNNKKLISQVYRELLFEAQNNLFESSTILHSEIIRFLTAVTEHVEAPITFELEPRISELFKAYNVKIDDQSDAFLERIINYMRLMKKACGISLFFFVNLRQYFEESEILSLYETLFYEKIYLIDIEAKGVTPLKCEKMLIIDNDLCMIEI